MKAFNHLRWLKANEQSLYVNLIQNIEEQIQYFAGSSVSITSLSLRQTLPW